ncbi:MAG: hypothetical protein DRI90_20885, partial [Deltaproteobacteria bacterium]
MKHEPVEAMFYEPEASGSAVRCGLCGHRCRIELGERGICQVRENQDGRLTALAYGLLLALSPDPIEKKPLSHFQPGSRSMSAAPSTDFVATDSLDATHPIVRLRALNRQQAMLEGESEGISTRRRDVAEAQRAARDEAREAAR